MGLGDITSRVMTAYKADTTDHRMAIRSLRGEEKARHQALLADMEAQNRKIDGQIARWSKLALGAGVLVAGFKIAQGAARSYLEDVRLGSAAAGASLVGLQRATNGLVEADTLLAFAGKTMHGVWKLNQAEMEQVLGGAMALKKTMGVELQPTVEALTEAITKGNTRALKEFGIEAKDKQGVLRELAALQRQLGGDTAMAGDEMLRSGVKISDAFDDMAGSLGKLVVELQPFVSALAEAMALIAQGVGHLSSDSPSSRRAGSDGIGARVMSIYRGGAKQSIGDRIWFDEDVGGVLTAAGAVLEQNAKIRQFQRDATAVGTMLFEALAGAAVKGLRAPAEQLKRGQSRRKRGGGSGGYDSGAVEMDGHTVGWNSFESGFGLGGDGGIGSVTAGGFKTISQMQDEQIAAVKAGLPAAIAELQRNQAAFAKADQDSILTQVFGTPAEIDAQVEAIRLAAGMFSVFTEAAGEAYDVLISGSGNAMAAFQKAIAGGVAAMGKEMFVKGISESAWAIADLARGNFPGAAAHGKAAGSFFAGAAVAGVVANQLGYGASSGGASAGGGAPSVLSGRSGGSSSDSPQPINVYVGSEWAGLSAIEQASAINRAIVLGKRGSSHIRRH